MEIEFQYITKSWMSELTGMVNGTTQSDDVHMKVGFSSFIFDSPLWRKKTLNKTAEIDFWSESSTLKDTHNIDVQSSRK